MARYWRIYRTFFVSSLVRELEFRANFFAKILQNIIWIGFFLLVLLVIYRNTDSVAGWRREDAFVLAATCFLINAVNGALFISLLEIPEQVRRGTLDFVITKPIDTQFWVSTRKFDLDQIGTLIAGIVMIAVGVVGGGMHPSPEQWIAYVVTVIAAITIFYALNLSMMTLGIWLVRVDNLWVLGETIMQAARYPIDIYGMRLKMFLTYALPLAFLASVPASQLVKRFDAVMLSIAIAWACTMYIGARSFWRFAMRHYSSASS